MQRSKVLRVIVTHQAHLQVTIEKAASSYKRDYVVVAGGYGQEGMSDGVIKLNCDDSYCGLPDKITSLFRFISKEPAFDAYTHFLKLDEDMEFIKEIDFELADYMGMIAGKHTINRRHHIGRSVGHHWNERPYDGEVSDWCEGGLGYIVSRRAMECIGQVDGRMYPLEDVMVGNVLENIGVYPRFVNINKYCKPNQFYNPIRSYLDFKGREWRWGGVPKWIFRTGPMREPQLPATVRRVYCDAVERNPGYQLFYFSDEDCADYIRDCWGEEYIAAYEGVLPPAYKADFWKYLILHRHGGCYGNFSQAVLASLDGVIGEADRVLVMNTHDAPCRMCSSFVCIKPGDAFLKRAIDQCKSNITGKVYGRNELDVTGSCVWSDAFSGAWPEDPASSINSSPFGATKILHKSKALSNFIVDSKGNPILIKEIKSNAYFLYKRRGVRHYSEVWGGREVFA